MGLSVILLGLLLSCYFLYEILVSQGFARQSGDYWERFVDRYARCQVFSAFGYELVD